VSASTSKKRVVAVFDVKGQFRRSITLAGAEAQIGEGLAEWIVPGRKLGLFPRREPRAYKPQSPAKVEASAIHHADEDPNSAVPSQLIEWVKSRSPYGWIRS